MFIVRRTFVLCFNYFAPLLLAQIGPPPSAVASELEPSRETITTTFAPRTTPSYYQSHIERRTAIVTREAEFYCLDGFDYKDSRCEKLESLEAALGCQDGWDYDNNNQCKTSIVEPAERYCSEGYEEYFGRCRRVLLAPEQLLCPPAYRHTEYGCVKDVETDPILECEKGELKDRVCKEIITSSPVASCPNGFEMLGTDACARRRVLQPKLVCPSGFKEVQNRCVKNLVTTPVLQCKSDATLRGGLCISESIIAPLFKCPNGQLGGETQKSCQSTVTAVAIARCPEISREIAEGLCVKEDIVTPESVCPINAHMHPGNAECVSQRGDVFPTSKQCPNGYEFHDKGHCIRRTTLAKELTCPAGFSLVDGVCSATDYHPQQMVCPEGSTYEKDRCTTITTYLPETVCPEGFSLDSLRMMSCVGEEEVQPMPTCDVGVWDKGEEACILAEWMAGEPRCPPESRPIMGETGGLLWCEEEIVRRPKSVCPRDFTLRDKGDLEVCGGRALADGELGCVAPYVQVDGKEGGCMYEEIIPKILGCAEGSYLKKTSCVRTQSQPAVIVCPDGYRYEQETQLCKKLVWSRAVPVCESGFTYNNLVGKCYKFVTDYPQRQIDQPENPRGPREESLLPLQVQPTTTTKKPVKARVESPPAGKEPFVPLATYHGQDAVKKAAEAEAAKRINPSTPVLVP